MFGKIIIAATLLLNYGYVESAPNPLTIIGGSTTDIMTYKFLVSVYYTGSRCGGSIIRPTFVITAAHCVHGAHLNPASISEILVLVGTSNPMPGRGSLMSDASELFEHGRYNDSTGANDISLLKLQQTLVFDDNIGAIGIRLELGTIIMAIGFGESMLGGDVIYTDILKEANLEIKSHAACGNAYGIRVGSQICAANENIRFCRRNQGSPVIFKDQLIGIVSLTEEEDDERGLTVLVRVPSYLQFILGIIDQNH